VCPAPKEVAPSGGGKYVGVGFGSQVVGDVFAPSTGPAMADAVDAVTASGDGITFSRTRDGGALCVAVLTGGLVRKWYCTDAEELLELLEALKSVNS